MNNKIKSFILVLAVFFGIGLNVCANTTKQAIPLEFTPHTATVTVQAQKQPSCIQVNPLNLIEHPNFYLNKNIKIRGKFDKFSTLGLDYTPAMRSSEEYISFLIQRPDVTDHNIPLSELKIFLKRSVAEKHIDLEAGDEIEFSGRVFSTALGDAWMDATDFVVLTAKPKTEKK